MTKRPRRSNPRGVTAFDVKMGERIRMLRKSKNLSQQELGDGLGISFQQVQKYEAGSNRISCERLVDIAEELATTPHKILGWNGSKRGQV